MYRTPAGRKWVHGWLLRLPVLGLVLRKIAVARFTRTLGTLLASGVPILDALDIVARTAGNVVVEEAVLYARLRISEGKNMAEPLMETKVFPPMVVQMVGVVLIAMYMPIFSLAGKIKAD
jgi:type IV pilus assembly protein PilC